MFLINMMTLKEEILEAEAVPPPLGKESRKLLGNSSNVCYRRVSTKAKASTVYCFLWEPLGECSSLGVWRKGLGWLV